MVASDARSRLLLVGLTSRPQDYLGRTVTVGTQEIVLGESYRPNDTVAQGSVWPDEYFPPAVTRDDAGRLVVVAGRRRVLHALAGRVDRMRVYVVEDWRGFIAWLALDAEMLSRSAGAMKPSEIARFLDRAAHLLGFTTKQVGKVDVVVAGIEGFAKVYDVATLRNLARRARETGDQRIWEDIDLVDRGLLKPSSVQNRILDRTRITETVQRRTAAEQRARFAKAVPALIGYTEGLKDMGQLADDITPGERSDWEQGLRRASRQLHQIIKTFRTEGEGTT